MGPPTKALEYLDQALDMYSRAGAIQAYDMSYVYRAKQVKTQLLHPRTSLNVPTPSEHIESAHGAMHSHA